MAPPGSGVCRFYGTANGCRYGSSCRYSHDPSQSTTPRGPSSSSGQSSPWRSRSQASNSQSSPTLYGARGGFKPSGLPHNACQFYWTSGSCNRGFDCSFRHVRGGQAIGAQETTAAQSGDDNEEDDTLDFFSPQGLAASAGSVREDRHTLNPSEVHNHLKEFLRDNFRFESAAQVQGFVRVLASVNDRNKTWVRLSILL